MESDSNISRRNEGTQRDTFRIALGALPGPTLESMCESADVLATKQPSDLRNRQRFVGQMTLSKIGSEPVRRCCLVVAIWVKALPLTAEADPDLGEPAIFIAEIGVGHMVHGGEHVPTLRQHPSDGTRLSKIGGATEGRVVSRVLPRPSPPGKVSW
jgi:hypothetical protein